MKRAAKTALWLCALLTASLPALAAPEAVLAVEAAHDSGAAAGGHAAKEAGLPQFDPSTWPSQIFWLAVIFAVLYLFFSKKALPEIGGVIDARNARINGDIEMAEKLRSEAETIRQSYETGLEKARTDAAKAYEEASAAVKAQASSKSEEFRVKSAKEIEVMEQRLAQAGKDAMEDMNTLAADIATRAAEKIVGISADPDQVKTVVRSLYNESRKAA